MKKRILLLMLAAALLTSACGKEETSPAQEETTSPEETTPPEEETAFSYTDLKGREFYFASGAGGWRTVLRVREDGSFFGEYSDGELGDSAESYPNGTYYYCAFEGTFAAPAKLDDHTFAAAIDSMTFAHEAGTEEIIDGIRYIYTTPYGLTGTEVLHFYLPQTPVADLPAAYMDWVRSHMTDAEESALPFYGLYNPAEECGFSSHSIAAALQNYLAVTEDAAKAYRETLQKEDLTQTDMNLTSQKLYTLWDNALNYLWAEAKKTLPEEDFADLLEEQRTWIAEKEAAVAAAAKEAAGGSLAPLLANTEAAQWTQARVYVLFDLLMQAL